MNSFPRAALLAAACFVSCLAPGHAAAASLTTEPQATGLFGDPAPARPAHETQSLLGATGVWTSPGAYDGSAPINLGDPNPAAPGLGGLGVDCSLLAQPNAACPVRVDLTTGRTDE